MILPHLTLAIENMYLKVCESPPFGMLLLLKAVISQHESVIINMQFLIHDCFAWPI